MWLHTASVTSTVGNKTRLFPSPFHVSTSSRLALAGAFWSDCVAFCSTALRSASEENEVGGYVTGPCSSKVKQHSDSYVMTSPDSLRQNTCVTNIHL